MTDLERLRNTPGEPCPTCKGHAADQCRSCLGTGKHLRFPVPPVTTAAWSSADWLRTASVISYAQTVTCCGVVFDLTAERCADGQPMYRARI